MTFPKYSMGIGDRFAHQGKAQLAAFVMAKEFGTEVAPVWNKSNREHNIVHSEPVSVRTEADAAVKALRWAGSAGAGGQSWSGLSQMPRSYISWICFSVTSRR